MICLNPIMKSPFLASIVAASFVMLYFVLMSYSHSLPPAVIISAMVGIFVYTLMGGSLMCSEEKSEAPALVPTNVPQAVATLPAANNPPRANNSNSSVVSAYQGF